MNVLVFRAGIENLTQNAFPKKSIERDGYGARRFFIVAESSPHAKISRKGRSVTDITVDQKTTGQRFEERVQAYILDTPARESPADTERPEKAQPGSMGRRLRWSAYNGAPRLVGEEETDSDLAGGVTFRHLGTEMSALH